jgi:hypothetical protein
MMEWKDLAQTVGKFAPMLGTLIGGPAGATAGAIVASVLGVGNTPDEVSQALTINPDAAVKLKQIEATRQVDLQTLVVQAESNRLAADTATIAAVNATMQAETQSEHWPSYSWRPFVGFIFGIMFLGTYFVLPLMRLPVPVVPVEAWFAIGGVLGVASWFRGKAQADPNVPMSNKG